jgi:phage-related minor tail protein
MGEAGPEAIMPLHRDSRGSLGVKSAGQGGSSTVVNVYNQTKDSEVETKESEDPNGVKKIDVYITQKIKTVFQTGQMDKTMQNNFGLSRAGVR